MSWGKPVRSAVVAHRTRFRAFAVEDRSVQLAWAGLGTGRHSVAVGSAEGEVDGGPGTWTATGLAPGTTYEVPQWWWLPATTR